MDDEVFFQSASFKEFFRGKNVRPLMEVTGISRIEFLKQCSKTIERTMQVAEQEVRDRLGASCSEEDITEARNEGSRAAYRELGKAYLFFFVVGVLGKKWLNTDYAYRLCADIQQNKWLLSVMLWVIAREHYKSTLITCFSTLWEIVREPNNTYAIISYNQDRARSFLSVIKSEIEKNETLRSLYPEVFWENPANGYEYLPDGRKITWEWNSTKIEVKRTIQCKEKTIECSGADGGGITGMHFSHLLMDDIETDDSVKTEGYIDRFTEAVTNIFNAGQAENLHVTMVGTFYARNDMYCNLIKSSIVKEAIIQSAIDYKTGDPIKMSKRAFLEKRSTLTPAVFATQYLCDPSMSESSRFSLSMVRRWDASRTNGLNVYTFVDPAGTITNKSDYTAMLTVGYDALKNIMVLDVIRDKLNMESKFDRLVEIYKRYRPITIYYEKVSMQADIDYLTARMSEYNLRFPITAITPKKGISKEQRIDIIYPEMSRIYFPYKCIHRNWQNVDEDMLDSFITEEMLPFPQASHDDVMDTLAMAVSALFGNLVTIPDIYGQDGFNDNQPYGSGSIGGYNPMSYIKEQLRIAE